MRPTYRIVEARESDLPFLPVIELAAARLLVGHAPEGVLTETTEPEVFRQARAGGRLWVAVTGETPVGFVHVRLLASGAPHLEEIDVHPSHGRQGLGRRLVATACEWTTRNGHTSLTLTTFRELPFNRRFYASCGFEEVLPEQLDAELADIVANEARRGLAPERRVVMRWHPSRPTAS
jgi:GNAT superfamily N-acetyltransferase